MDDLCVDVDLDLGASIIAPGLPAIDNVAYFFDGASFVLHANGDLAANLPAFAETLEVLHFRRGDSGWDLVDGPHHPTLADDEADYCACMLGLRDYVEKNGFTFDARPRLSQKRIWTGEMF